MRLEEVSDAFGVLVEFAQEQICFLASRISSEIARSDCVPRHVGLAKSSLFNRLRPSLVVVEVVEPSVFGAASVNVRSEDVVEVVRGTLAPVSS